MLSFILQIFIEDFIHSTNTENLRNGKHSAMPSGECKHEIKIVPALKELSVKEARLLCPWDFPGKNTGVDCHTMHAWSPASPALQVDFLLLEPPGKPERNTTRVGRKREALCEGTGKAPRTTEHLGSLPSGNEDFGPKDSDLKNTFVSQDQALHKHG